MRLRAWRGRSLAQSVAPETFLAAMSLPCDGAVWKEVRPDPSSPAVRCAAMTYEVALVTDRAGSFATMLSKPVPRSIEGGQIIVTTVAAFDCEEKALAFLRALRGIDVRKRERTPQDLEILERYGLSAVSPPGPA